MSQNTKHHRVTNYRRRDLRNTLESRLGLPVEKRRLVPQLFRLKITNIGLDVSDYTILDIIKEFGEPEYINFRDHKDSRSCISDFKDNEIATKLIEKYNNFEINGKSIQVTLLDQQKRKRDADQERRKLRHGPRGGYGSHYTKSQKPIEQRNKTVDELNAELDAYMKGS